jgi:hypothetical protein
MFSYRRYFRGNVKLKIFNIFEKKKIDIHTNLKIYFLYNKFQKIFRNNLFLKCCSFYYFIYEISICNYEFLLIILYSTILLKYLLIVRLQLIYLNKCIYFS